MVERRSGHDSSDGDQAREGKPAQIRPSAASSMTHPLLYYITDRRQLPADDISHRPLLEKIQQAARNGVDLIQLREKDLSGRQLERLGEAALEVISNAQLSRRHRVRSSAGDLFCGQNGRQTLLLINSRCDIALAIGADGVHLRSDDIGIGDARLIARRALVRSSLVRPRRFLLAISCHRESEVRRAAEEGADFVVFGPVFGKADDLSAFPSGLEALHQACRYKIPVLALGGITMEKARLCLEAGAAGVAGIRLFQDHDIASIVDSLAGKQCPG